MNTINNRFTLVELLVIASTILAVVAIISSAYKQHTIKANFAEVISATSDVKKTIDACFAVKRVLRLCSYEEDANVAAAHNALMQKIDSAKLARVQNIFWESNWQMEIWFDGGKETGNTTYAVIGKINGDNGRLVWVTHPDSSCITQGLCES